MRFTAAVGKVAEVTGTSQNRRDDRCAGIGTGGSLAAAAAALFFASVSAVPRPNGKLSPQTWNHRACRDISWH